jgi:hypothetical protein
MTSTDPTQELIHQMLHRRASAPPAWLEDETVRAIRRVTPRRSSRWAGVRRGRLAAVGGMTAGVLLAAMAFSSGLVGSIVATSPVPSDAADLASPPADTATPAAEPDSASPEPTPALAGVLATDSLARVTLEGDRLRVRSEPGTGGDSKMLEPLLRAGDGLLVLGGPQEADGYDWYRVHADASALAGWVAAGKDGIDWIEAVTPECPESVNLGDFDIGSMSELLVCNGGQPIDFKVDGISDVDIDGPCPWAATDRVCSLVPGWMAADVQVYESIDVPGDTGTAVFSPYLALHPDVAQQLGELPEGPFIATLVVDHPDAQGCRIVDNDGADVVAPWVAVVRCRLQAVLVDVQSMKR